MKPKINTTKLLFVLLIILTPISIILSSVRLLLTPAFLELEYRMPGFPADPFGFTLQDRLHWSKISVTYLLNNASIEYFDRYQLDPNTPLYNERELSHMDDVKQVVQNGRLLWLGILIIWVFILLILFTRNEIISIIKALAAGGWATIGLMFLMGITILLSFDFLFTEFHNLFFESGTWTFYYSDTFIRLFPIRFWQDAFLLVGFLSIIISAIFILISKKKDPEINQGLAR